MEIKLSQKTFKALANPTRIAILKYLDKRRYTQSELADMFGFAVTSIKQHIDDLKKTGLVKVIDEGRKWKYIELTKEGKAILHPEEKKIWILLGTFVASVAGGIYTATKKLFASSKELIKTDDALLRAPLQKAEILPAVNTVKETAVQTFSQDAVATSASAGGEMVRGVAQAPEVLTEATKVALPKASLNVLGGRPELITATSKTAGSSPDILFYIFLIIAIICIFGIIFYLVRRYKRLKWISEFVGKHKKKRK